MGELKNPTYGSVSADKECDIDVIVKVYRWQHPVSSTGNEGSNPSAPASEDEGKPNRGEERPNFSVVD